MKPTADNRNPRTSARSARRAFTLIELMLVVALLGIIAGLILPSFQPAVSDQLVSTARTVASDIMYCRDLAVGNSSRYTLTFDLAQNQYSLAHSGAPSSLDDLPANPFATTASTSSRQFFDLDELPHLGPPVRIVAVQSVGSTTQSVRKLELGPLGQTTRSVPTRVWLACGSGDEQLYIYLQVDPVTGLVDPGELQSAAP